MLQLILENKAAIGSLAVGIYEVVARQMKTTADVSIVNLIKNVVDFFVPNKTKDGGNF